MPGPDPSSSELETPKALRLLAPFFFILYGSVVVEQSSNWSLLIGHNCESGLKFTVKTGAEPLVDHFQSLDA